MVKRVLEAVLFQWLVHVNTFAYCSVESGFFPKEINDKFSGNCCRFSVLSIKLKLSLSTDCQCRFLPLCIVSGPMQHYLNQDAIALF